MHELKMSREDFHQFKTFTIVKQDLCFNELFSEISIECIIQFFCINMGFLGFGCLKQTF